MVDQCVQEDEWACPRAGCRLGSFKGDVGCGAVAGDPGGHAGQVERRLRHFCGGLVDDRSPQSQVLFGVGLVIESHAT